MRWIGNVMYRIRALFGRGRMERELDDEFAFHLEMEARKLEARGMSPEEARRQARIAFGGVERQRESAKEAWGVGLVDQLRGDLRYAVRQLLRTPTFALLAVGTLAVGIGGTVALGSVVDGLLIRPLPVADESRLATFWAPYNWTGAEFEFTRERLESFDGVAAFSNDGTTLRTPSGTSMLLTTVASADLFDVLGTAPLLGRTFQPGDDGPGAEPVVVLSHGLWEQEFGADPGVIGRRVTLDGASTTVVGVMPQGFYFPTPDMRAWVPLPLYPEAPGYGAGWLVLVGRTAQGAGPERVAADLQALATGLGERFEYPAAWDKSRNPTLTPLREYLLGDVRPAVLLLMGAVALLLVMACANVASLLLTRGLDRSGEMAVRAALGAGRGRLARQVLTEALVISVAGGLLGLGLGWMLFDTIVAGLPLPSGFADTLALDGTTVAVALALSVVTGAVVALAPIRGALSGDPGRDGFGGRRAGGTAGGAPKLQRALVVVEVVFAVVLVTGATVLVRTVGQLRTLDSGIDPEGVLSLGLYIAEAETTAPERDLFFSRIAERARALPGVEAAGLINRVPIRDGGYQGPVYPEGRPDLTEERRVTAYYRTVSPGALEALGVRPEMGRLPTDADAPADVPAAVVNREFARRFWNDEAAVGRHFTTTFRSRVDWQVVGVIPDVAIQGIGGDPSPAAYHPWAQGAGGATVGHLLVRVGRGDPSALVPALRAAVREIDPRAAVDDVTTLGQITDRAMAEALRLRFFLTLFSALGLVLAVVGIYGVVSYAVDRRRGEFGIRMALGAPARTLVGRVVLGAMGPVGLGIALGSGLALGGVWLLARWVTDVDGGDPLALAVGVGVLAGVGALAALVPALRISATGPGAALRAE